MSENPYEPRKSDSDLSPKPRTIDFSLVRPHRFVIAMTQLSCLILSAITLDGGQSFRFCIAACIGHWVLVALICARRGGTITSMERWLLRWGLFPCVAAVIVIAIV